MGNIADLPKKKDERYRNACMIVYPESAMPNWRDYLRAKQIPFVVSPLHDKDLNPEAPSDMDGDGCLLPKKPHYHVAFICDGNHSKEFFDGIAAEINAYKHTWKINNLRSMIRYFCHLDDPDKFQYPENEMQEYCGANIKEYMELSGRELMRECKLIQRFIREKKFTTFEALADFLCFNNYDDWYYIVTSQRTLYFTSLMRDKYFNSKEKEKQKNET